MLNDTKVEEWNFKFGYAACTCAPPLPSPSPFPPPFSSYLPTSVILRLPHRRFSTFSPSFVIPGSTNSWQVGVKASTSLIKPPLHPPYTPTLPFPPPPPLLKPYVLFSELHFRSRKRRHAAAGSTQVCLCQSLHGQLCAGLCFGCPNSYSLPQRQPSHSDQIFSGQRRRAAGAEQSPRVLRRGALTIN
jgi:hypothetical protein